MAEHIQDLGVIVNDRDGMDKSNDRSLSTDEAVIPLRMPHNIFDRLQKAATFHNFPNVETYCISRLMESLNTKVGAAYIDAPSAFSGQQTQKISGPMGGIISRG